MLNVLGSRPKWRAVVVLVVACLTVSGSMLLRSPLAHASPTPPYRTHSYYEYNATLSSYSSQGANDAGDASTPSGAAVILAFGRPAYNGTYYGVLDYGSHFQTFAQILGGAESFASGYWAGTYGKTKTVLIMLGFSNNNLGCSTCSYNVPTNQLQSWAQGWGHMVNNLQTFLDSAPAYTTEYADGGIDAEPHYDPSFTKTNSLVTGFNQGSAHLLDDYGSTDGNGTSWWTWQELYDVEWGGPDAGYKDEINQLQSYNANQISYAAQVYQWGVQNKGGFASKGVMVQCFSSCSPTNLDYATAYNDYEADLYADFHNYQTMPWTTAI